MICRRLRRRGFGGVDEQAARQVAIITGGARGMGAATARAFAREGAIVTLTDMLEPEGTALAAEIGGSARFLRHDVSSEADWQAVVADVLARHGRIDALVNNAGVVSMGPLIDIPISEVDRVYNVNVKGPLLGMKYVGRSMCEAGSGSIVNIASVDGFRGVNGLSLYSSSKWALRGMTKGAALEFGPHGVRVNSLHPGGVNTPMANPGNFKVEDASGAFDRVPLQRIGEPEEIAATSLFLCSDEASYITGAEIAVDGGWSAGYYNRLLPEAPQGLTK